MDRDRHDYTNNRVLNWNEPNRFRARFKNTRQNQQLSTSNSSITSSGSSTNAPRGSFLDRGPPKLKAGGEEARGTDGATTT